MLIILHNLTSNLQCVGLQRRALHFCLQLSLHVPFGEDLWNFDLGINFDMCPTDIYGFRTERGDLDCVVSVAAYAFPDHAINIRFGALQEEAGCVSSMVLLAGSYCVSKRCRRDGCHYCGEPFCGETDLHGFTRLHRRFGMGQEFEAYLFGAFLLYTHPTDCSFFCTNAARDNRITRKLCNRLIPAIFVGVAVALEWQWARTYQVVPLACLLSESRAFRVSTRTLADVIIPDFFFFHSDNASR